MMNTSTLDCGSGGCSIAPFLDEATYDLMLRRAASILRSEGEAYLFEPADLVHEAFLRLARSWVPVRLHNADHLVALTTVVMRRVMIDHGRSAKSSGRRNSVPIDSETLSILTADDGLPVRDALARLADCEDRLFRVVEMRFFGGYDFEEIASALEVSSRTVKRDWSAARERLQSLLGARSGAPTGDEASGVACRTAANAS